MSKAEDYGSIVAKMVEREHEGRRKELEAKEKEAAEKTARKTLLLRPLVKVLCDVQAKFGQAVDIRIKPQSAEFRFGKSGLVYCLDVRDGVPCIVHVYSGGNSPWYNGERQHNGWVLHRASYEDRADELIPQLLNLLTGLLR